MGRVTRPRTDDDAADEEIATIRLAMANVMVKHGTVNAACFIAVMSEVIGSLLATFPPEVRHHAFREWVQAVEREFQGFCKGRDSDSGVH